MWKNPALRQWTGTAAAMLVSTYLLDVTATLAGLALVASSLFQSAGLGLALVVLTVSYVAWGAALRPALAANWALLERTGASTSLPSKLAHSLALRRGSPASLRRLATTAGYVATELVKEAPYYLGAAGAALMTDRVSSSEALVFLAGANLGAAAYELVLARLSRVLLARLPHRYATFETDWDPAAYLDGYYRVVEPDERRTIAFMVETARNLPPGQTVLLFGAGPTLHHAFPFATRAKVIDLCDLLPANLREIERWVDAKPAAHDWGPFVRHTLECGRNPRLSDPAIVVSDDAVSRRETLTRACIGRLLASDLRDPVPLPGAAGTYDVVVSAFCADSATDDLCTWALYMRRIAGLVRPGGMLVVAALLHSRGYRVGNRLFPSANIDEEDLRAVLAPLSASLWIETCLLPEQMHHGYGGIVLARAKLWLGPATPLIVSSGLRTRYKTMRDKRARLASPALESRCGGLRAREDESADIGTTLGTFLAVLTTSIGARYGRLASRAIGESDLRAEASLSRANSARIVPASVSGSRLVMLGATVARMWASRSENGIV